MTKHISTKKILIALVLIASWFVLTALYLYQRPDLTVLIKEYGGNSFSKIPKGEFLKGEKIIGSFVANENNLGQVSVRFYNYDRINSDEVSFRMKEKGAKDWFYEHTYKTDQFQPHALFPFGFPIISDSKGKQYDIEIQSMNGKLEDAVTISNKDPLMISSYQYPKSSFTNPRLFAEFISKKIAYTKYDADFIVALGRYVTFITLSLFLLYLFIEYLFSHANKLLQMRGQAVIVLGLLFLVLNVLLLYLRKVPLSATIAIIGYFFLVIGVIWLIIEMKLTMDERVKKKK